MAKKPKREKGERWGKKREDKRDWKNYNEELVLRGNFLLDLDMIQNWDAEVAKMNAGKRGAPFVFPESLIELQAVWNQFVGVRQVEGITRELVSKLQLPEYNDYTTIHRRIRKLNLKIEIKNITSCFASTDGSGVKMHNAGEYRQVKYGHNKRRWVEVIITADPVTKDILNIEVDLDGEGKSEPEVAIQHLKELYEQKIEVKKFWGDGAFDVKELFNLLDKNSTESAIPPRDNATSKSKGSMRRAREVKEYKSKEWDDWAKDKEYGLRWPGTEGIFSSVKCIFGECTRAKKPETACLEAKRKFWAYQKMKNYAKA